MILFAILLIIYLLVTASLLTRCVGNGTIKAPIGEAVAAIPIAMSVLILYGPIPAAIALAISTCGIQMGHTNIYHMGSMASTPVTRLNRIDKILSPIAKLLRIEIRSTPYCWLGMATKGTIIGLPLLQYAPILSIGVPVAYHLSFNVFKKENITAEYILGPLIIMAVWLSL